MTWNYDNILTGVMSLGSSCMLVPLSAGDLLDDDFGLCFSRFPRCLRPSVRLDAGGVDMLAFVAFVCVLVSGCALPSLGG